MSVHMWVSACARALAHKASQNGNACAGSTSALHSRDCPHCGVQLDTYLVDTSTSSAGSVSLWQSLLMYSKPAQ